MTRVVIDLKKLSGSKPMTKLLASLACLGADDEIELILSHDPETFQAMLIEQDCACERLHDEEGRGVLRVRRRP